MSGHRVVRNFAAPLLMMLLVVGCGTVEHRVSLDQAYRVDPGTKVVVGSVTNKTGQSFDINVEKMLGDALAQALKDQHLDWTNGPSPKLTLTTDIVEYAKGDALKRWLVPGWGSTALVVRATLTDSNGRNVGSVEAKRTVDAGGAYTIGAWETVFKDVAQDIVSDLTEKTKQASGASYVRP
jgi:Domain of unknown function (DUF4410)